MLVLLGPSFDASEASYQALARATGLVPYDLKNRIKPGVWGCIKVVGDLGQARDLGSRLLAEGFPVVLVDQHVAHDPDRRHVAVHRIELRESDFRLELKDREMIIPYRALTCIVEGEVQPGRTAARGAQQGSPSSGSFRAVAPGVAEMQVFRDAVLGNQVGYLAADLHFATVLWVARIDTRTFDFGEGRGPSVASELAELVDEIAKRASIRVDRTVKTSSVASVGDQPQSMRSASWPPVSQRIREEAADQRFDTYSRLIGEAERLVRQNV